MKFTIERSQLIKPLQQVFGALGSKGAVPILSNLLVKVDDDILSITATDLEVELICNVKLDNESVAGSVTVPSRKFLDICKALSNDAVISFTLEDHRALVKSGRSRFSLATIPAENYPNIEDWQSETKINISQANIRALIEKTQFSMAMQDVRYFLNGMLFEVEDKKLCTVATDGHRMGVATIELDESFEKKRIIVPRKGVQELLKLLDDPEQIVSLQIGSSNIRAQINNFTFTSKLIDGNFPDHQRVLPRNTTKTLLASCEELRQAFLRVAILSNEKFRGVRVFLNNNEMRIMANNPEQEEAEELLEVSYEGDNIEIGFNVNYVLEVLNTIKSGMVRISMLDGNSSTLIESVDDERLMYVVMPIRL